jgi:hypothetical protein
MIKWGRFGDRDSLKVSTPLTPWSQAAREESPVLVVAMKLCRCSVCSWTHTDTAARNSPFGLCSSILSAQAQCQFIAPDKVPGSAAIHVGAPRPHLTIQCCWCQEPSSVLQREMLFWWQSHFQGTGWVTALTRDDRDESREPKHFVKCMAEAQMLCLGYWDMTFWKMERKLSSLAVSPWSMSVSWNTHSNVTTCDGQIPVTHLQAHLKSHSITEPYSTGFGLLDHWSCDCAFTCPHPHLSPDSLGNPALP